VAVLAPAPFGWRADERHQLSELMSASIDGASRSSRHLDSATTCQLCRWRTGM